MIFIGHGVQKLFGSFGGPRISGFTKMLEHRYPHRGFDNLWYLLAGEASTGHSTGPSGAMNVVDAQPGTRFMLMAGKPYGETPFFNGPYVD